MSLLGVILNPQLYEDYHCAILSAEQDQGISHFHLTPLKQFLAIEANEWGDICHRLTSYWGSFDRLDGIEICCRLSHTHEKTLYLIFDNHLEQLETRITRLGYLLNQQQILIFPKGSKKLRRYLLNGNGLIFSPQYKERDIYSIYDAIRYYFRSIYQKEVFDIMEYKENGHFRHASIIIKSGMHLLGGRTDKRLSQIEIGQYFEIKEEN